MGQKKTRLSGLLIKGDEHMTEDEQNNNVIVTRQQFFVKKRKANHKLWRNLLIGFLSAIVTFLLADIAVMIMVYSGVNDKNIISLVTAKIVALVIVEIEIMKQVAELRKKYRYKRFYSFKAKKLILIFLNSLVALAVLGWIFFPNGYSLSFDQFMNKYNLGVSLVIALQCYVFVVVAFANSKFLAWLAD